MNLLLRASAHRGLRSVCNKTCYWRTAAPCAALFGTSPAAESSCNMVLASLVRVHWLTVPTQRDDVLTLAQAEPLTGPAMARYCNLARDLKLWLSLGGFQEKDPGDDRLRNCHVVVDAEGAIAATYRKIHLFDVDVPNGPVLMESNTTAPGSQMVVCDSPAGRLGLTVCYDLRFPELYQRLTWDLGAQLLLVPSAFTRITGEAHWEVLLRARAIECQSYVIAAAQAGRHSEKRESYGHSLIIDPWGSVVARLPDPHATGIATAEVDLDKLAAVRAKMPIQQHRLQGHKAYFH